MLASSGILELRIHMRNIPVDFFYFENETSFAFVASECVFNFLERVFRSKWFAQDSLLRQNVLGVIVWTEWIQ